MVLVEDADNKKTHKKKGSVDLRLSRKEQSDSFSTLPASPAKAPMKPSKPKSLFVTSNAKNIKKL